MGRNYIDRQPSTMASNTPTKPVTVKFAIGMFLFAAPFAAAIAFLLFIIGPLLTLLVILLAAAGGLVATLGLHLVSL